MSSTESLQCDGTYFCFKLYFVYKKERLGMGAGNIFRVLLERIFLKKMYKSRDAAYGTMY